MYENQNLTYHQGKMKIELILKRRKKSIDRQSKAVFRGDGIIWLVPVLSLLFHDYFMRKMK